MARQIGPDQSERIFYYTSGSKKGTIVPAGTPVPLYADAQVSVPADVRALDGSVIAGTIPTVLTGDTLEAPQFLFPDVDDPVVYTRILGGPVVALHPSTDARIDALRILLDQAVARIDTLEANPTYGFSFNSSFPYLVTADSVAAGLDYADGVLTVDDVRAAGVSATGDVLTVTTA